MITISSGQSFYVFCKIKNNIWFFSKNIMNQTFTDEHDDVIVRAVHRSYLKCVYTNYTGSNSILHQRELVNILLRQWDFNINDRHLYQHTEFRLLNNKVIDLTEIEKLQCNASMQNQGLSWRLI